MSENTKIEWADFTFNGWEGCTKVSPGCTNCYAEARDKRFTGGTHWGKGAPRRLTSDANWNLPVKWNREAVKRSECANCGEEHHSQIDRICLTCDIASLEQIRPRVFCASLADWLDDEVPIEWLSRLLALIHATPNLDWLLLSKRVHKWRERIKGTYAVLTKPELGSAAGSAPGDMLRRWFDSTHPQHGPPHNVWIGTTVEDQARADERIPQLLRIPARVRFLSCEPLLEEVDISFGLPSPLPFPDRVRPGANVDWVICGGESGAGARPMHPAWARGLRDQCAAAGVPFFMKQMNIAGKLVKAMPDFPEDIRRREFPNAV